MVRNVCTLSFSPPLVLFSKRLSANSMLADHSRALNVTDRRNYAFSQRGSKKPQVLFGPPSCLAYDIVALNEWKIATAACFLTYPHYDGGGLGTFMHSLDGLKIWIILRLKCDAPGALDKSTAMRLVAAEHALRMEDLPDWVDVFVLMLTPGNVL